MKLYTKTVCPKCIWVKDTIDRLNLTDKVKIVNTDVDAIAKQEVIDMGIMALPVFVVEGEALTNPTEINAYLNELD